MKIRTWQVTLKNEKKALPSLVLEKVPQPYDWVAYFAHKPQTTVLFSTVAELIENAKNLGYSLTFHNQPII